MYSLLKLKLGLHFFPLAVLYAVLVYKTNKADPMPETVRIMSFNLWHGGDAGKQPLDQTIEVIEEVQVDVVGLQETAGLAPEGQGRPARAAKLARRLGWHYIDQGERTGIISRYQILGTTSRKLGIKLVLPSGRQSFVQRSFGSRALPAIPTLEHTVGRCAFSDDRRPSGASSAMRRGAQVNRLLAEVNDVAAEQIPMFVTGDFNEPSHRDWTVSVAARNQCRTACARRRPMPVRYWKTSQGTSKKVHCWPRSTPTNSPTCRSKSPMMTAMRDLARTIA